MLLRHPTIEGSPRHHEMIDAEHLRDRRHHIGIEPVDRSANHDDGSYADNIADESQEGAQLVRKNGLNSQFESIEIKRNVLPHKLNSEGKGQRASGCA